jgi:hypothetical protein
MNTCKRWRSDSSRRNVAIARHHNRHLTALNSVGRVADFGIASRQVRAAAFVMLILSSFPALATVYHSDGSEPSVRALHNAAHDGDTITLPAGTFRWTSRLDITKGITLQGQTTVVGAGTANPTVTDATIIQDDVPRGGAGSNIIKVTIHSGQSFRVTGISFQSGAITTDGTHGAIRLTSLGDTPVTSMRLDHCHFDGLHQGKLVLVSGWVYGVADHNVMENLAQSTQAFNVWHDTYGGSSQINGNGSWADYPWYGTEKFFFIEDNTIIRSGTFGFPRSLNDADRGGRWVARHNYLQNMIPSGHGTEGVAAIRGQRVNEFYDNTINMTVPWGGGGQRSGTSLWHDNIFIGIEPQNGSICNLPNYRETFTRPHPAYWGIADGTSVWDQNDTEGNGTYVEGHPPYLFDSGTATRGTVGSSTATITDATKNWRINQWVGYSIKNTNPGSSSYTLGSFIIANTSNTITYRYSPPQRGDVLAFNAGDTYEIHRVLTMMDQNGRGKGGQITGNPPINRTTARRLWTHQALEPCYSWNNVHTPTNHALGFRVPIGQPTTKEGVDFFNLGANFAWDTTPSEVSACYTAALNGVDFTGTFVYPHPLVTGAPTSPPTATPMSRPHLQKKKKDAKKVKRRKGKNQAWIRQPLKRHPE